MFTVPNSEAEIINILNFYRMRKVMDVLPLCHKVVYKPRTVAEGEGHFSKHSLSRGIPPVV